MCIFSTIITLISFGILISAENLTTYSFVNFSIFNECQICRSNTVLANPNATVPHLNLSCWKAELGGKLGFIDDCNGVREVCYCEAIDVGDVTNTTQMPWTALVGMSGDEARTIILQDMPSAIVEILPWGTLVSMEYRADRVRIFVDEETGEVKETPRIG